MIDAIPADEVRRTLERVLARDELHASAFELWLAEVGEDLRQFFRRVFDGVGGDVVQWTGRLVWVLLAAAVVALVALTVVRLAQARRSAEAARDLAAERADLRVAELRSRAREAESQGDLLLALRLYFFALVVGLSQRGELEYRDAWTNRELLERGRPSAEMRARLAPIVRTLDRKSFGAEPVERADVAQLAELCGAWLGGGAA